MHSKIFDKVKKYYDKGWYTKEMVADFVEKGKLTPEEYEEITGEEYVEVTE